MWDVIQLVLKTGFRSSEFVVAVLGLLVTVVPALEHFRDTTTSPVWAAIAGITAAVISAAYSLSRGHVKKAAIVAAADSTANVPPVNQVLPGPGSAELEEAHRSAVVAATAALDASRRALEQASQLAIQKVQATGATSPTPAPAAAPAGAPGQQNG